MDKEENGDKSVTHNSLAGYDLESERYSLENDSSTLLKLNCKLFVLANDKINWLERGYGILKIFDSSEGYNCRISKIKILNIFINFKKELNLIEIY